MAKYTAHRRSRSHPVWSSPCQTCRRTSRLQVRAGRREVGGGRRGQGAPKPEQAGSQAALAGGPGGSREASEIRSPGPPEPQGKGPCLTHFITVTVHLGAAGRVGFRGRKGRAQSSRGLAPARHVCGTALQAHGAGLRASHSVPHVVLVRSIRPPSPPPPLLPLCAQPPHQQSLAISPVHSTSLTTGLTTTTGFTTFTTGTTTCLQLGAGWGSGRAPGHQKRCTWCMATPRGGKPTGQAWVPHGIGWQPPAGGELLCLPPRSPPALKPVCPAAHLFCHWHAVAILQRAAAAHCSCSRGKQGKWGGRLDRASQAGGGCGVAGWSWPRAFSPGPASAGLHVHGQPSKEGCKGQGRWGGVGSCEGSPAAARTSRQAVSRHFMVASAERDGEE